MEPEKPAAQGRNPAQDEPLFNRADLLLVGFAIGTVGYYAVLAWVL